MIVYPHREKLLAAIENRKAADDVELLQKKHTVPINNGHLPEIQCVKQAK